MIVCIVFNTFGFLFASLLPLEGAFLFFSSAIVNSQVSKGAGVVKKTKIILEKL